MRKFLILPVLLLSACANYQQMSAKTKEFAIECSTQHKSQAKQASCTNESVTAYAEEVGYKDMDLIELANTKRLSLAKQVDRKKLSREAAAEQMAELNFKLTEVSRQRHQQRADAIGQLGQNLQNQALLQHQLNSPQYSPRRSFSCRSTTTGIWTNTNCY